MEAQSYRVFRDGNAPGWNRITREDSYEVLVYDDLRSRKSAMGRKDQAKILREKPQLEKVSSSNSQYESFGKVEISFI